MAGLAKTSKKRGKGTNRVAKALKAPPKKRGAKTLAIEDFKRTTNGSAKKRQRPDAQIVMPKIQVSEFLVPIKGVTPLIMHKFSDKARLAIEEKQQQKAKIAKAKRDPKAEYLAAMYVMPGTGKAGSKTAKYGVPASAYKQAAVSACRYIDGLTMTFIKGAFHVIDDAGGLVQIKYKSIRMRDDTVRIGPAGGTLDLRYRPEFTDWSTILLIRYNEACISPEQIVNLFNHAGFHVGVCELRAEKGYSNGSFEVVIK